MLRRGAPRPPASVSVERETGFEPATPSLEGWRSTAELFPRIVCVVVRPPTVVGRRGFEPLKAFASRFTVCPLWPLGYLPENRGMRPKTLADLVEKSWRWREDSNPRPTAYKAVALP